MAMRDGYGGLWGEGYSTQESPEQLKLRPGRTWDLHCGRPVLQVCLSKLVAPSPVICLSPCPAAHTQQRPVGLTASLPTRAGMCLSLDSCRGLGLTDGYPSSKGMVPQTYTLWSGVERTETRWIPKTSGSRRKPLIWKHGGNMWPIFFLVYLVFLGFFGRGGGGVLSSILVFLFFYYYLCLIWSPHFLFLFLLFFPLRFFLLFPKFTL